MSTKDDEGDRFFGHVDVALQELQREVDLGGRFDKLAAQLRKITSGRDHTPAERLQREGHDER